MPHCRKVPWKICQLVDKFVKFLKFLKIRCIFLSTSFQICQLFKIPTKKCNFFNELTNLSTSWIKYTSDFLKFQQKKIYFLQWVDKFVNNLTKLYFFNFKMKKIDKFVNKLTKIYILFLQIWKSWQFCQQVDRFVN